MLINEQNSFILGFLTSIGYKFIDSEFTSLTNQETGEIANLVRSQDQNGSITYNYQFKNSKVILAQNYSDGFKDDFIRLVTSEMTYNIENTRHNDELVDRTISFKSNNGVEAELDFNTIGDNFDKITTTTISHSNGNGGSYLACKIFSDLTHLNYQPYDLRGAKYSLSEKHTTDISVETYFKYILENLSLIFGRSISKQEYDTISKVVSGLSDNVKIMMNLPITNSQKYLENIQYHLSHLTEKYTEKMGRLLRELDRERAECMQILDSYSKTLDSLGTEVHKSK